MDHLALTDLEVARLTRAGRELRVRLLLAEAHAFVDQAEQTHIYDEGRTRAGLVVLFSGGNDSTVLAHIFRNRATHAAHANTTIGIEQTRQFVRDVCADWDLPLIEKFPGAGNTYRELVLERGFPGPGHHYKMFQRLKERGLRQVQAEIVKHPRRERVVFIAGRRRQESDRRANIPEMERVGSAVWVSPLVNWTKLDLNTYRLMHGPVPINQVTELLHMSGECLCGSFAHDGEFEEVAYWYPDVAAEIEALEQALRYRFDLKPYARMWGWGGDARVLAASRTRRSKSGRLCSSCAAPGGEIVSAA